MQDYTKESPAPWTEYNAYIKSVTVDRAAEIDDHAFDGCKYIEEVNIYRKSNADNFFKENYPNVKFNYLGVNGDVNKNSILDKEDAAIILKYCEGVDVSSYDMDVADCNGISGIDITDAIWILRNLD